MTSEPAIAMRAEQPYVAIPIEATFKEWGQVNALVGKVFDHLAGNGVAPAGPLFYRYWVIGDHDRKFSMEVGVPVPQAMTWDGEIISGSIPAGRYVTLVHHGHPDGVADAHARLQDWVAGEALDIDVSTDDDHEVWSGRFEFYLTNPADEPNPDHWSTELAYLITGEPAG